MYTISMPLRVLLIVQICAGLWCLLWMLTYPFAGIYFSAKSDLLLIESVMGKNSSLNALSGQKARELSQKFQLFSELFSAQDETTKKWIENLEIQKNSFLRKPILKKLQASLRYFFEIPFFEFLWATLAIVVPLALLIGKAWARQLAWLLPMLVLAFSLSNIFYGIDPLNISERHLFPRESNLLEEPLTGSFIKQQERLSKAWKSFLIMRWAEEIPSINPQKFETQAITGEFYFNLERLRHLPASMMQIFWERKSLIILGLYFLWNLALAAFIWLTTRMRTEALKPKLRPSDA